MKTFKKNFGWIVSKYSNGRSIDSGHRTGSKQFRKIIVDWSVKVEAITAGLQNGTLLMIQQNNTGQHGWQLDATNSSPTPMRWRYKQLRQLMWSDASAKLDHWEFGRCFFVRRCYSNRDNHRSDTMGLLRFLLIETTVPAKSKSGPHPIFTAGHLSSLENIISCSTVVGLLACQWKIVDPLNGTSVRRSLAPRKKSTLIHTPFAKKREVARRRPPYLHRLMVGWCLREGHRLCAEPPVASGARSRCRCSRVETSLDGLPAFRPHR